MKVVLANVLSFYFLLVRILILVEGQKGKEPVEMMDGKVAV